jgi:hypothetical protein
MRARLLAGCIALAALPALALETAQWPPPAPVADRMRELQLVIIDRDSTLGQREAAREELSGLLKSPAGQKRGRVAGEQPARARAAIDPFPSVVVPVDVAPSSPPPPAGVARLEVVEPPQAIVDPRTGSAILPGTGFAIDPRTGGVLHAVPGGYIDPRTGQVIPR